LEDSGGRGYCYKGDNEMTSREFLKNFLTRKEYIEKIRNSQNCDILVVGGGIHGAAVAHLAALNGLQTILLERDDYASGTSSRSSKMAHGGLRYLEAFDFRQVFEGVKAREELFRVANHIVSPEKFLVPIKKGNSWFKFKLGLGLSLYDLFLKTKEFKHRWISAEASELSIFGRKRSDYQGGFIYADGILDDSRLVLDTILAARQEGAICLNHALVKKIQQQNGPRVVVKWTDQLTGNDYETETGAVINCAGPWAPEVGDTKSLKALRKTMRYSQGTHILFNKPWIGPSLLLPLEEKGRYYFVWPHPAGTMVGTTERELVSASESPLPQKDEIEEIYTRLEKDLPESGLNRESAHYCFAGIRVLPIRKSKWGSSTASISRKHQWYFDRGVLSLVGGKLTTAFWTALEGLKIIAKMSELKEQIVSAKKRNLPGAGDVSIFQNQFENLIKNKKVDPVLLQRAVARYGVRINYFLEEDPTWLESIGGECLRGELELALDVEQAENLEDVMNRRLGIQYMPGAGINGLNEICEVLGKKRPKINLEEEMGKYKFKINQIRELIGK